MPVAALLCIRPIVPYSLVLLMEYRNPVPTRASRGFGVTKPNYSKLN